MSEPVTMFKINRRFYNDINKRDEVSSIAKEYPDKRILILYDSVTFIDQVDNCFEENITYWFKNKKIILHKNRRMIVACPFSHFENKHLEILKPDIIIGEDQQEMKDTEAK